MYLLQKILTIIIIKDIENNYCKDKCIVRNVYDNKIDCTFVSINHDDNMVIIE